MLVGLKVLAQLTLRLLSIPRGLTDQLVHLFGWTYSFSSSLPCQIGWTWDCSIGAWPVIGKAVPGEMCSFTAYVFRL